MTEQNHLEQAITGERRIATILFCDVKGSTSMAEKLDPEEWASIMNRAYEYLITPVTRHGGTVAQLLGDAILAYFGAPLAHEDDPQRAVLAGLEIITGIRSFREQLHHERGLDFNVRVGINTGLVMAGQIGSGQRITYTAVGDTVNLAARMEQTAQPGTVQITAETHKFIAPLFECESLGQIEVKGKSEPIQTYRVLSFKRKPGQLRGFESQGLGSPLVGRGMESTTLNRCIDGLLDRQGGIIGIIGEAGLGKSRLLAETKSFAVAKSSNILWLEGQTLSFGQTISYWPFQQILRGWAGITEDDDIGTSWSKLENQVRALFSEETIDYLPYLATLLALEVRGEYAECVKDLDGDAVGKQIFLSSRRFFERLANRQPTILVFEDLHWMDESSTLLLEHLLPLVEIVPLLIFGLSRPERDTPAARVRGFCAHDFAKYYTEIRLTPLSDGDSAQLIHNLLDIENMPGRLHDMIVGKAEGNPFFLEEVIRNLMDAGAVTRDAYNGRWRANEHIETIQVPNTIQGVIMARVDRLDDELKQVLRVASVIGRSFLYRVLKSIAEAGQRLDNDLRELQATELIREKQHLPELEYMFRHALAHEATYESILLQKRRELHARVAQAIELLFAERLEEFYGFLAYHYAKAEVWDKAQTYLLRAGDQAARIAADAEAVNLYQQALVAYARAFGDHWDPLQRASLERKMGEAFMRRSEYPLALEHCGQGLMYLGYQLPISRWQVRRALLRELIVQLMHRLYPGFFFKSVAEPADLSIEDEAFLYGYTAYIDARTNSERFLLLALRLINFSERCGYRPGVVMGSYQLGIALDLAGLFRLAGTYHHSGMNVAETLQQAYALGGAYTGLQVHAYYMGELARSLEYGHRSAQVYRGAGHLEEWGFATSLLASVTYQQGQFAEAVAYSKELIRVGQDASAPALWCWGESALGSVLRRQGQLQETISCQQKALELAQAIPDYIYYIAAGADLSLCYLRQGNWQTAVSQLERCQRVAAEHQVLEPFSRITMFNNLAEVYLFVAEHSEKSERTSWLSKARQACKAALKISSSCRIRAPKAMRMQGRYEWLRGRPVAAEKWWQKGLAEARRMSLRYDLGMIHLELGQHLGDHASLEKAEAIFSQIGAELDLMKTKELLQR